MRIVIFGVPLVGLMLGLVGCGGGPEMPPTVPVAGTVTFDGKPLEQGTITFEPSNARQANGKIVEGKITEVTTFEPGDGAVVGAHKVTIFSVKPDPDDKTGMATTSLIPQKYGDPEQSDLTAVVKADGSNEFTFALKSE